MKIVLQRVRQASVQVEGASIGSIGHGLLLLVGFSQADLDTDLETRLPVIAQRVGELRVFEGETPGKLMHSALSNELEVLAVPQFTLYADTHKGRRPGFHLAMPPEPARSHFHAFVEALESLPFSRVQSGKFGADMQVSLTNDGPITLVLEY